MCGRYSVVIPREKLQQQFSRQLTFPKDGLPTNYNVAPTTRNPVITNAAPNEVNLFRWGLVPFWAKDLKIGARMINARREGIEKKPSFRKAIREKRCLVLADSFYEWQRNENGKTPFRIQPTDGSLLIMAGIWEQWTPKESDSSPVYTYSVITGEPNAEMEPIHDRMPMLLQSEDVQEQWLSNDTALDDALSLLRTPKAGTLTYYPVSSLVGNVRNNGPELHEPAEQ